MHLIVKEVSNRGNLWHAARGWKGPTTKTGKRWGMERLVACGDGFPLKFWLKKNPKARWWQNDIRLWQSSKWKAIFYVKSTQQHWTTAYQTHKWRSKFVGKSCKQTMTTFTSSSWGDTKYVVPPSIIGRAAGSWNQGTKFKMSYLDESLKKVMNEHICRARQPISPPTSRPTEMSKPYIVGSIVM